MCYHQSKGAHDLTSPREPQRTATGVREDTEQTLVLPFTILWTQLSSTPDFVLPEPLCLNN